MFKIMKTTLNIALLSAATAFCIPVNAQTEWPTRPITIVVPGGPGSVADSLARKLGEKISGDVGQPIVVDNKAGAGGILAYEYVSRQKADGYTLLLAVGGLATAPAIYKTLKFDPIRSFTPIAQISVTPMIMVVGKDSSLSSLANLVAHAKSEPEKMTYGSFGSGSTAHLVGESLNKMAGVKLVHVPYKTGSASIPDLISGQLDIAVLDPITALPLVNSGRLRALAIAGPSRVSDIPDVPTVAEAGYAFPATGWLGLFAPAGLPDQITLRLNTSVQKEVQQAEIKDFLTRTGSSIPESQTPLQWKEKFRGYVVNYGKIARDSGMVAD